jgi:outer membrane protein OmpA-like peptidoglycan-associated protein
LELNCRHLFLLYFKIANITLELKFRKIFILFLPFALCPLPFAMPLAVAAEIPAAIAASSATIPDTNLALSADTSNIEEGKALYENGQMIAALGKFMTVLRKDPHNPEARQYLRMIIDIMRQNPAITASKMGSKEQAVATNPAVEEEIRRMLQLRSRLTLDLKAIPAVQVEVKGNINQVWIESPLLFGDHSGGLKEQGVPVLDRAAAWLKTYGQQPVIIHCYPEELQEASTNGSLFLHRYSELFNFFVEERKLPAQRFVSADLLAKASSPLGGEDIGGGTPPSQPSPTGGEGVDVSTASRIVIETIGSQSAMLDAMPSMNSTQALSQWLENSITPNRKEFNPEEGEWVDLDLAALSRMGLRSWTFTIVPAVGKTAKPVFQVDGKGNLLKRLSWDGHDQKTGDFARAGSYVVKLVSVNSDGTIKSLEDLLQVDRTTKEEPSDLVEKPKSSVKKRKAKKPVDTSQVTPTPVAAAPSPTGGEGKTAATGGQTPSSGEDSGDSAHTIWKQVVQFEPNQSDLMPSVKSSLERIGKTLEVYPLQKVRITGFAMMSETDPGDLARKRAESVRSILVDEYHVDTNRVIVAGGKTTSDENASKVEMSITN